MNTPIHAIAFDLDGTLIDSLEDLCIAANHMRQALNKPELPRETVRSFIGDGAKTLVARCLEHRHDPQHAPDEIAMNLFLKAYDHVLTHAPKTVLYPQVFDALHLLSNHLPLALITNKPLIFTEKILTTLELTPFFKVVLGGDSLAEKKPSPLPLQIAATRLNCPLEGLLMVGDSENDVIAAQKAGAQVVFLHQGYGQTQSENVHKFNDFATFFSKLRQQLNI